MVPCRLLFQQKLTRLGVPAGAVHVYTSPFSRTVQTAQVAAEAAVLDQDVIQVSSYEIINASITTTCESPTANSRQSQAHARRLSRISLMMIITETFCQS